MGFGALVSAIQGDTGDAPRTLLVDSFNVLRQAGSPGNLFGVPESSIEVTERGPGGVSSMIFDIVDPLKAITPREAADVAYWDSFTNDSEPIFRGWIQTWSVRRLGLGRIYTVKCIGVEAVLDWLIVPSFSALAGTALRTAIQAAAAQAIGIGVPLRAFSGVGGVGDSVIGSQIEPVARMRINSLDIDLVADVTLPNPTTLREVITALYAATRPTDPAWLPAVTVDALWGLRCWNAAFAPGGYAPITVTAADGAMHSPENLVQSVDATGRVRGVFVKGGNAAGTGAVGDGSGLVGAWAVINDSSILTEAARDASAQGYLRDKRATGRGSFTITHLTIQLALLGNVRAGSLLTLTDAETGATGTYPIGQLVRRYHATTEDWTISFGGMPGSFARAVRRLTRATLS